MVVLKNLNALGQRKARTSANTNTQKSAAKGCKERNRASPCKICRQPGLGDSQKLLLGDASDIIIPFLVFERRQKGGFVTGWFWQMYPRSGFRSGGTCKHTLVPVFVPGEHLNVPSFRWNVPGNFHEMKSPPRFTFSREGFPRHFPP